MKLHKKPLKYEETKEYYYVDQPVYKTYKKVRKYNHCEDCGQTTGFYMDEVGVGLLGYKKTKHKKDTNYLLGKVMEKAIEPLVVDSVLNRPIAFSRLMKSPVLKIK